jgi:repressor LexA
MASSDHERLFDVKGFFERVFAFRSTGDYRHANRRSPVEATHDARGAMAQVLSTKRKQILDCISAAVKDRGYPPSVREIGESVGLTSSSTVHSHLAVLQREGYLRRDPTKPRAIEVCYDPSSKVIVEARPLRHVPLIGEVAAGTGMLAQENVEELYPLPEDFTGTGTLFMVKVRGDSMIEAGIMDGDCVVVRQQPEAEQGDIVVAGIPDGEATVKRFSRRGGLIVLIPANERLSPMEFDPDEVTIYGKVVTVLRRL